MTLMRCVRLIRRLIREWSSVRKLQSSINAQGLGEKRKRKRIVSLNPSVTSDNGTSLKVKQLSDHNVMWRVRRKSEVPAAPLKIRGMKRAPDWRESVGYWMSRVLRRCLLIYETLSTVILRVGYFTGVPQLLPQHSSALRKRAVGLTYAYWLTSVEHSPH